MSNLHGNVFPPEIFALLDRVFSTLDEAIAASPGESDRFEWAWRIHCNPPIRVRSDQGEEVGTVFETGLHSASLVRGDRGYYWQPDSEEDRQLLERLQCDRHTIPVDYQEFRRTMAVLSDEDRAAVNYDRRTQPNPQRSEPPVLLIAARQTIADDWKRRHPEVAHRCRYINDPKRLQGWRHDTIVIRLDGFWRNPVWNSAELSHLTSPERTPIWDFNCRIENIEERLRQIQIVQSGVRDRGGLSASEILGGGDRYTSAVQYQQMMADRTALQEFLNDAPLIAAEAAKSVRRAEPEQITSLLEELDRICASTITRDSGAGRAFLGMIGKIWLSNDQKAQQLAVTLQNKFSKVGLMTPAEYRHIKSSIY